jgi:hypothetical protein
MSNKRLLLVEGHDDIYVLCNLFERHNVPECFAVVERNGIERLLETLPNDLRTPDLERLGIVVDANTDIEARWAQVRNILIGAGNGNVPHVPDPAGTIIDLEHTETERLLRVGVWLMPDNHLPGMLENFVAFLVPPDDALWPYAEDCLQRLPEPQPRFRLQHFTKAHLHTWLAWQEDPGTPMGLAITKGYLNAEGTQVQQLVDWIRRLFVA